MPIDRSRELWHAMLVDTMNSSLSQRRLTLSHEVRAKVKR
jgi:hypothetical protein